MSTNVSTSVSTKSDGSTHTSEVSQNVVPTMLADGSVGDATARGAGVGSEKKMASENAALGKRKSVASDDEREKKKPKKRTPRYKIMMKSDEDAEYKRVTFGFIENHRFENLILCDKPNGEYLIRLHANVTGKYNDLWEFQYQHIYLSVCECHLNVIEQLRRRCVTHCRVTAQMVIDKGLKDAFPDFDFVVEEVHP